MSELSSYYTSANQSLLSSIPRDAKRILEIGCGAGALGAQYLSQVNNDCEYWGVEYVDKAAEEAKKTLKTVIKGSIEDDNIYARIPLDYFDVLVFGDVLEHLHNPWTVLKRLSMHMRQGAQCVACIPNIQHWSIFRNMLGGNWTYEDSGLMDRTHLRFFTRKSMVDMFDNNGWKVTSQSPRYRLTSEKKRFVDELLQVKARLGITDPVEESDFLALQWIMTAKVQREAALPKEPMDKPELKINYCFFVQQFFDVRTTLPANDLAKLPGVDVVQSFRQIQLGEMLKFDGPRIVILQRPKVLETEKWLELMARLRKADCVVVYDVDDHPALLESIGFKNDNRLFLARSVTAIQTSTENLVDFYSGYSGEVRLFGNSCHNLPIFRHRQDDRPTVFFGAFNRHGYSAEIAKLISPVLERYGAACHVVSDKAFFDALSITDKAYHDALEYERYLAVMRRCNIMLSPLQGGPGEEYKSDIKYVEASAQGLATIASRLVYGATIIEGETGLIADSLKQWPEKLEYLLNSPVERQRLAFNAWDYVRGERLFAAQAPLRVQWYMELWNRRNELWEQVAERLPEIKPYL